MPRSLADRLAARTVRWLAAIALGAASARAQEVHGVVRTTSPAEDARQASVALVSASGEAVVVALAQSDGRYRLRAPARGVYRVRVRRIGFAPDSSPLLRLDVSVDAEFDARLTRLPTTLTTVRTVADARCVATGEAGPATLRLWSQAQSAFSAVVATAGNARIGYAIRRFERELDPRTGLVRRERTWDSRTSAAEPWSSAPPESLAVHGFVRTTGPDRVYFAPDARTLTSEPFVRTHCLRTVRDAEHPGLVGLEFAPSARPDSREAGVDVTGALWLDATSEELRRIEFRYVAPRVGRGAGVEPAAGQVDYRRIADGGWIVDRWLLQIGAYPTDHLAPGGGAATVGVGTVLRHTTTGATVPRMEVGGEVRSVYDAGVSPDDVAALGIVRGRIADSVGRAEPGVRVSLAAEAGAERSVTTDSAGAFALDSVVPGRYTLAVAAPRFDTLNLRVVPTEVDIGAASALSIAIVTPSAAAGLRALCPTGVGVDALALHGRLRDAASGRPIAGARVTVSWLRGVTSNGAMTAATSTERATSTDDEGRWAMCDLPAATRLVVWPTAHGRAGEKVALPPDDARIRRHDLTITLPP